MVGATWGFHLEQLLRQMEERGALSASPQQQEEAVAAVAARIEALAADLIVATRGDLAALAAHLRAAVPEGASEAAMVLLLQSAAFHGRLKGALDAALAVVAAALEPHLAGVAADVHGAMQHLARNRGAVEPLDAFADSFLPHFSSTFSLALVEATLLRTLWQDA